MHRVLYDLYVEDQAFSSSYDLAPPSPPSPLSSQQDVFLCQSSCVSSFEFTDGRGEGGAKSYAGEKA
jgi:hypothetical protein